MATRRTGIGDTPPVSAKGTGDAKDHRLKFVWVLTRKRRGSTFQHLHIKTCDHLLLRCLTMQHLSRGCLGGSSSSSAHNRKTDKLPESVMELKKRDPPCSYRLRCLYQSPTASLSPLFQPILAVGQRNRCHCWRVSGEEKSLPISR